MDLKETLNLPKTDFPMKANLTIKEKEILEYWEKIDLYRKLVQKNSNKEKFILHDGPPYANGHIHLGTALNKILKDIIVKSRFMLGFRADFLPGWDCHGLPIEHQIEKELKEKKTEVSKIEMRKLCRAYAEKYVNIQREEFKRLGCIGDWENPYITMDYDYQAVIVEEMAKFFLRGEVYRKKKPVHWCINCKTALAEAEIEYEMEKTPSIYVKFPLKDPDSFVSSHKPIFILIWTTTPWTLPANLAVAINPTYKYVLLETERDSYIILSDLAKEVMEKAGISNWKVVKELENDRLRSLVFRHPFIDRDSIVVFAEYVAKDVGTGIVHIAPGHGEEDYETGMEYGLETFSPVDEQGRFTEEVTEFAGMDVFSANRPIIEKLKSLDLLLHEEILEHSYPHCWRCKKPVIFRATEQWFISLDSHGLRNRALKEIENVRWIPSWGKDRISNMLSSRPDWCISRQRSWGIPITIFYCKGCGEPFWNEESFERIISEIRIHGADIWFEKEAEYFLPDSAVCTKCGSRAFRKEEDIIDVWFDSGVSWAAVLKRRGELNYPADLYLEGSDQHRGWFHSSLLTSVANEGISPYKACLTHGFVVDGSGRKMSKSLGNIIVPEEIIDKYGAEILRLWVTYEDFRNDMRISNEIISRLVETYRRIRNTLRFLHSNLFDFDPKENSVSYENLSFLDKVILSRLVDLVRKCKEAYLDYNFHVIYHAVLGFCTVDLSSLYLDMVKDRLYVERSDSKKRRGTQTVIFELLTTLAKLIAPILSSTAEEVWMHLKGKVSNESVLLCDFPELKMEFKNEELEKIWERVLEIRDEVNKKIEEKRAQKVLGHSLDASVTIRASDDYTLLLSLGEELRDILIVSEVNLIKDGDFEVMVDKAQGEKCERCWHYSPSVGKHAVFPNICSRCVNIISSL